MAHSFCIIDICGSFVERWKTKIDTRQKGSSRNRTKVPNVNLGLGASNSTGVMARTSTNTAGTSRDHGHMPTTVTSAKNFMEPTKSSINRKRSMSHKRDSSMGNSEVTPRNEVPSPTNKGDDYTVNHHTVASKQALSSYRAPKQR